MKAIYLIFITLITGLWNPHRRFVSRHRITQSSSQSEASKALQDVPSPYLISSSDKSLFVDDLRKSKALYQFILTFSQRAQKELSFSLFIEQDFASFLFGVLRFNRRSQWASFPDELKLIIHQYVEVDILNTSNEQVTRYVDILWCLGKLSTDFNALPRSLQAAIFNKLATLEPASIGREVSRVLYSFSLMQLRWSDVPPQPRRTLLSLLTTYLPSMNVVEVVNTVYALGRMGCFWSTLPKPLYQDLLVDVQRSVPSSGVISISNLLWYVC